MIGLTKLYVLDYGRVDGLGFYNLVRNELHKGDYAKFVKTIDPLPWRSTREVAMDLSKMGKIKKWENDKFRP